ncbi:Lipase, GDSL [Corchorus capsularis]|uniref:Lipase, GDSL n=1 Tax=Corchorus capsularis TaxID=210143 RepID=A0A1R3HN47_COCAP|nr:Lipase, GDSL [Corchorus capsularis]
MASKPKLPIPSLFLLVLTINLAKAEPQVPCYFIFGDSLSDNGNNNNLPTLAKVNYPPYGIDFPEGPTGRFCNGRNMQDFIVEHLGFQIYDIPPFAEANKDDDQCNLKGVNYASGSAGIRDETGQKLGERVPLNEQLRNHKTIISRISRELGDSSAKELLSQCIYSLAIGNNDYINNYFQPEFYNTSLQYTPEQYAAVLVEQYSQQIKSLYNDGARKFALYGVGLIGCPPYTREVYGTIGSVCVDKLNAAANLFNERLMPLVEELNRDFTDAKFTYLNPSPTVIDYALSGIVNFLGSCCEIGGGGGELCVVNSKPCIFRNQYIFWDGVHPSEAMNKLTAGIAYQTKTSTNGVPFTIQELAEE